MLFIAFIVALFSWMILDPRSLGAVVGTVGAIIVIGLILLIYPAVIYPLPTLALLVLMGASWTWRLRRRRYGWREFGWLAFGLDLLLIGAVVLFALLLGATVWALLNQP